MNKKEVIIAVIIGLVISGLVVGGILRAKSAINSANQQTTATKEISQTSSSPSPQDTAANQLFLKITAPANNSVIHQNQVTLTGETLPNTYIAIITDASDYLIVPNKLGQFSQKIKLIKGANLIKVTVYTKTGDKVEKSLNLVYTSAEI